MKRSVLHVICGTVLFCLLSISAYSATYDVTIQNFSFNPPTLTIAVGDTVKWTNQASISHTSTSGSQCTADGKWDSGLISSGGIFTHTFTSPGTFPYFCEVGAHCSSFGMIGVILVNPLLGDINNDGIIDISDVILVLRMALKIDPIQPCSDINNDGVVDISDVILTLRMALKLDPLQQCI